MDDITIPVGEKICGNTCFSDIYIPQILSNITSTSSAVINYNSEILFQHTENQRYGFQNKIEPTSQILRVLIG